MVLDWTGLDTISIVWYWIGLDWMVLSYGTGLDWIVRVSHGAVKLTGLDSDWIG